MISPLTIFPRHLPKILILAFWISCFHDTSAQTQDSITHHYDSLAKVKLATIDSSGNRLNNKIDSIQLRTNNILNPNLNTLTSKFRRKKLQPHDTLRATQELDSMKRGLSTKIDSLKQLNLPTEQYSRKLDSLNNISPQKYIDIANSKVQSAEDKINRPIDNIESKVNDKLNVMRQEGGDKANIPGNLDTDINNPLDVSLDKPSIDNPSIDKLPVDKPSIDKPSLDNPLNDKISDIKAAPQEQIDKVKSIDEIKTAQDKLGDANQATDKLQSYQDDVKNIAKGNLDETKNIQGAVEEKAKNLDEIKELNTQTAEMDKAKSIVGQGKDPDAMKDMAKQEIRKQAVNHFKGKEEALKAAMDKMSKLKQKYPEVSSIKDLPKRPPNPMKGKPLIERIVPGLTLQIQHLGNFAIDINPVVSYRFSGRINGGLGWNERLAFAKWNKLSRSERIYGPRVFGSFGFKKGFSAKAEIEKMNALIPPSPISPDGARQWVWSAFVGLKKDYKFWGTARGNVQVLYNIYDDHDNSPYADRLNVRMGFEFPMKKAKKPSK